MAVLNFDAFWRDHGAKAGLRGLSKEAKEAEKSQEAFKAKAVAAGAIVGAALFKMGQVAVQTASDTAESQSKVGVVFGKSAAMVEDFASRSAKSMGISKATYLEAAGTLGNLLVSLKLPQSEAAKMSTKMLQLASDMASFNNATPEEALEALRAGLVGETEPLRRFGVNLNDATLRQKALEMGLVTTTKDVLPAAVKAQATYALVLEQTTTAQGDFERTSDGLANQTRILKAQFSDLQGELGEKLLPAAVKVAGVMVDFLTFLDDHGKAVAVVGGSFLAVAGGIWAVNKAAAGMRAAQEAVDNVTAAWSRFTTEGGRAGKAAQGMAGILMGPWGLALAGGVAALGFWQKSQADARRRTEELRDALDQQTGAITSNARELAYQNLVQRDAIRDAKLLGINLSTLTDAALGNYGAQVAVNDALERAQETFAGSGRGAEAYGRAIRNVEGSLGVQNKELQKAREGLRDAQAAGVTATDTSEDMADATASLTGALGENNEELDESVGLLKIRNDQLDQREAQRRYAESVDAATESLKANKRTLDVNTKAGRDNGRALDDLAKDAGDYYAAAKKAGESTDTLNRIQREAYRKLRDTARAMGMGKREADNYARAVLGIPDRHETKVKTDTKSALSNITTLKERLRTIPPKWVTVGARVNFPDNWKVYRFGNNRAMAHGGGVDGRVGDGVGTVDEVPAMLMRGEHVWTTREVQGAGGHSMVTRLRRAAARGELRGFAAGGPVATSSSGIRRYVSRLESQFEDAAVSFGRVLQSVLDRSGYGSVNGGWRGMWAAVHRQFPGAALHSAYRPGAITATGNRSYHSMGRAIDVTPSMAIFNWIRSMYGGRTRELIYSPAGWRQIHNGRPHYYTGVTRNMHWDHVHWAYDRGGIARGPGWIPKATNLPERVLSPSTTLALDSALARGIGDTHVTLVAPNYLGSMSDVLRALESAAGNGQLNRVLDRARVSRR